MGCRLNREAACFSWRSCHYQFGSYLATGELVYLPDPVETARRLAQPWRYEQRALWEEGRAA